MRSRAGVDLQIIDIHTPNNRQREDSGDLDDNQPMTPDHLNTMKNASKYKHEYSPSPDQL